MTPKKKFSPAHLAAACTIAAKDAKTESLRDSLLAAAETFRDASTASERSATDFIAQREARRTQD